MRRLDYEKLIQERWQKNRDEVRKILIKRKGKEFKNLFKKILTFEKNFGYDIEKIITAICENEYLQAMFAVDPRKQNIDENLAFDWLKEVEEINNLTRLPASGANAFYVSADGDIRQGKNFRGSSRPSKSLDFRWKTGNTIFWAMHKRTTSDGGAQGNTKLEMTSVIRKFQSCDEPGIALVLILDGDFWDNRRGELQKLARTTPPKSFAVPIHKIPDILKEYL